MGPVGVLARSGLHPTVFFARVLDLIERHLPELVALPEPEDSGVRAVG